MDNCTWYEICYYYFCLLLSHNRKVEGVVYRMWYLVDGGPSPPSYRIEKYHHNIGWWFICYSLCQPIDTSVWLMTLHNIIKISFISHHLKNRVSSNKQSCVNISTNKEYACIRIMKRRELSNIALLVYCILRYILSSHFSRIHLGDLSFEGGKGRKGATFFTSRAQLQSSNVLQQTLIHSF